MISSSSNQQIKNLVQLQTKSKARNKEKVFTIEGIKMFQEVLRDHKKELVKTFVAETCYANLKEQNPALYAAIDEIDYELVSDKVFKEISETMTPQGILSIVKQPEYDLDELLKKETLQLVLLEDLRDPGNLGTIVRTAEGAGMDGIILTKASVDMFNPKVIRSTMGAIYRVPFFYVEDMKEAIQMLQNHKIKVYATHLHAANYYDEAVYADKSAILIGNEANGLTEEAAKASDELIKIPMEGQVESLNAGVATAIVMYEMFRQRRAR